MTARALFITTAFVLAGASCGEPTGILLVGAGGPSGPGIVVANGTTAPVRVRIDGVEVIQSLAAGAVSAPISLTPMLRIVQLEALPGSAVSGIAIAQVSMNLTIPTLVTALSTSNTLVAGIVSDTAVVPAAGKTKLRVINLASQAPAIDVWRTQPDYESPIRLMFPFIYGASSSFAQSTPGDWDVIVTLETAPVFGEPDPRTRALAQLGVLIPADVARTMLVLDAPGGGVRLELVPR